MKPSEYTLNDPIAAIATALSPSALGIVRTSGSGCIELSAKVFSHPQKLINAEGNTLVHGWIVNDLGEKIDEVIACVYRSPKSFTGEDAVDFIGHGGPATVMSVFRILRNIGFRQAERGEFTFRAFAHGKTDLSRAEAIQEIVNAQTDNARSKAVGRLAGNLSQRIHEISAKILHALAAIEVEIEYPEDEETTKGAFDAGLILDAHQDLENLHKTWAAEKLYQEGVRLVLAGKTNAGKSSLFNTLLKEERAIVSDIHGTTRDWLESRADFLGIPFTIFDTAGLRETQDLIEAQGVDRSKNLVLQADVVLYVIDSTQGLQEEDLSFIQQHQKASKAPLIIAWNKADHTASQAIPSKTKQEMVLDEAILIKAISAKKGLGINELVEALVSLFIDGVGSTKDTEGASLGTERQKNAVFQALLCLEHALTAASNGFPMDAVGQDLEDALSNLGEITGEVTGDDVLNAVFSGFCVGK